MSLSTDEKTLINEQLSNLLKFIQSEQIIQEDFSKFIKTISSGLNNPNHYQAALANYAFERKLNDKYVSDYYLEKNPKLSKKEKEVFEGFKTAFSSVFKIEKVTKDGFDLYNLVNEKNYTTNSLLKMNRLRGLSAYQYISGRIFQYKKNYYLSEITNIFPSTAREQVHQLAILKQLEKPELLYKGNDKKLAEIEKNLETLSKKFEKYFESDEFVTTSKDVDNLLNGFNEFVESNKKAVSPDIAKPEKYEYFKVKEINNGINTFTDALNHGFSTHEKTYDVGVVFDKTLGLNVLPFYGTFKKIFSSDEYKSIKGYKHCILNYFTNPKIPPEIILKIYGENSENFMEIVSETLNIEKNTDINEVLKKYKPKYYETRLFTSPTILYCSKAFNEMISIAEVKQEIPDFVHQKIGRNDPCPCGSNKKYKKCCFQKQLNV